jgi:hypothetical protein
MESKRVESSARYWNMWRIDPTGTSTGYQSCSVAPAKAFFAKTFGSQNIPNQKDLIAHFQRSNTDVITRAQAGLCLRCYVSQPILNACRKINNLFGSQQQFTYRDLLPFVLNDDAETFVVIDEDGKTQLILDRNDQLRTATYQFFSIEVLQSFKSDTPNSMSLDNWVYLQTKQNNEVKNFLAEFGFKNLSDWALLNRVRKTQLERLSESECQIVKAFHSVYRRDRRQQPKNATKCADPSLAQLHEMLSQLPKNSIAIADPAQLLIALKQIASQLRQYDIWRNREPLEIYNSDDATYTLRSDLPHESSNASELEQQELLAFFTEQLKTALLESIEKSVADRLTALEKSKYAPFATKFVPGLQQYYVQGLSLKEISPQLGMTSWDQARRILNPGDLLNTVRTSTLQQVLERLLAKLSSMGIATMPPEPDYLQTLMEQIAAFADAEIFREAAEEIRAGKNRSMQSVYAHNLRSALEQHHHSSIPLELHHA